MLEGLLVDLVPYDKRFKDLEHKWWNSPAFYQGSMGDIEFISKAQMERRHQRESEYDDTRSGVPFGIQTKDGKPIGYFGLNWVSYHERTTNLGAIIGEPEYIGGGYGMDAMLLTVDYAFNMLDIRKIWLNTMSLNVRVIRMMSKVPFTLEARQRKAAYIEGQWADILSYGMFREEWPGREAMIAKLGSRAKTEE
jgi:RimJ/RimL family protein N-acetyltransferase